MFHGVNMFSETENVNKEDDQKFKAVFNMDSKFGKVFMNPLALQTIAAQNLKGCIRPAINHHCQ
jgi:hypothetical protein